MLQVLSKVQGWQTGSLYINATMTSRKWKISYDCDRKYRSEWEKISYGYRNLPMNQILHTANCGTIVAKV